LFLLLRERPLEGVVTVVCPTVRHVRCSRFTSIPTDPAHESRRTLDNTTLTACSPLQPTKPHPIRCSRLRHCAARLHWTTAPPSNWQTFQKECKTTISHTRRRTRPRDQLHTSNTAVFRKRGSEKVQPKQSGGGREAAGTLSLFSKLTSALSCSQAQYPPSGYRLVPASTRMLTRPLQRVGPDLMRS
jgi:hypothetical protein